MTDRWQFDYAPPRSWEQFEELCADTFQDEFGDVSLVRNGRAGQRQHGVDIVARAGSLWPVGIQCKRKSVWPVKQVTCRELEEEVTKARDFEPPLRSFILVSSAPDDAALQERARELDEQHRKDGLFGVAVFGWGELVRRATRHGAVASKHFGVHARGEHAPLLRTWTAECHELLVEDRELDVEVKETIHDLIDNPRGRLAIRQRESEELLLRIKARQSEPDLSLDDREEILKMRGELKKLEDRERRSIAGLELLLRHDTLGEYVRLVWKEHAAFLVRSFVEQELDPGLSDVTGLEKIRIAPPDAAHDDTHAVFLPSSEIVAIQEHRRDLHRRYPKVDPDFVGELPDEVCFGRVLPALVRTILNRLDDGESLTRLVERGWLDTSAWRVSW
ncbi:restriction endonuclease [Qipengyuania profunda]|jgi:hypothetical protein|uniref:restriction endonuclease n=1 Tax=Qipengyuania profunda TaxID=3113984 RepID=UPI002A18A928|nr:restriction endonuclease [Qipengyuania sp. HL-TH1]WPL57933.1 restriction endonuclease [Qipengyuania sp. HL-TH5]